MSCAEVRENLDLFLDGDLEGEDRAAVEAHLAACEACREEADALRSVVGLVREIPRPTAPDGFSEGVLARLPRTRRPRLVLRLLAPLAAAACLLLAVRLAFPPPADGPPAQETANQHESGDRELGRAAAKEETRRRDRPDKVDAPYSGPRGEVPEGIRTPADPRKPGDLRDQADEISAVHPEPAADRKYLAAGKAPDATAGLILAELEYYRESCTVGRLGSSVVGRLGSRATTERVEADAAGEPAFVVLSLTPAEEEYLVKLLDRETGLRLRRVNGLGGKAAPPSPAGPPADMPAPCEPEPDGEAAESPPREAIGVGGGAGALVPAAEAKARTKLPEARETVLFRFAR